MQHRASLVSSETTDEFDVLLDLRAEQVEMFVDGTSVGRWPLEVFISNPSSPPGFQLDVDGESWQVRPRDHPLFLADALPRTPALSRARLVNRFPRAGRIVDRLQDQRWRRSMMWRLLPGAFAAGTFGVGALLGRYRVEGSNSLTWILILSLSAAAVIVAGMSADRAVKLRPTATRRRQRAIDESPAISALLSTLEFTPARPREPERARGPLSWIETLAGAESGSEPAATPAAETPTSARPAPEPTAEPLAWIESPAPSDSRSAASAAEPSTPVERAPEPGAGVRAFLDSLGAPSPGTEPHAGEVSGEPVERAPDPPRGPFAFIESLTASVSSWDEVRDNVPPTTESEPDGEREEAAPESRPSGPSPASPSADLESAADPSRLPEVPEAEVVEQTGIVRDAPEKPAVHGEPDEDERPDEPFDARPAALVSQSGPGPTADSEDDAGLAPESEERKPGRKTTSRTARVFVIDVEREPDDLTEIRGIGPTYAGALAQLGVRTFRQLAAIDDATLTRLSDEIGSLANRIEREQWREQAAEMLAGRSQQSQESA